MLTGVEFKWANNKELNPKCKYLFLGTFTSSGKNKEDEARELYYYTSSSNHFWYLVDSIFIDSLSQVDFSGMSCADIKKAIEEKGCFANLIKELKDTEINKRDQIRQKIRKMLNEQSYDICDLFKIVGTHIGAKNSDSNIKGVGTETKLNELYKLITPNFQKIYCTSKRVEELLLKHFPRFKGKTEVLIAPTTGRAVKLDVKIEDWRKKLTVVKISQDY